MTYVELLTAIGLEVGANNIGADDRLAARRLILDAMGCALAGRKSPGIASLLAHLREQGGNAQASLLTFTDRLPMSQAALFNSALIHALDLDDVHNAGLPMHMSSIIISVALAVGQAVEATGCAVLLAVIAGIEVAGRLAVVCSRRSRGPELLPTSLLGGFGAVVTASRLLKLSRDQIHHAMGIQFAQACGNRQALLDHSLTKRLQPGFAARAAVESVLLASRGVTGPVGVFEGKAGLFKIFMNGDIPLPEEFLCNHEMLHIRRVSLKRYPSCGACHHVQIATERLLETHPVRPDQIIRVELFGCDPAGLVTGPFDPTNHPSVSAQFSAEWAVAHTLLRGPANLQDYTDSAVSADVEVIRLANEIQHLASPAGLALTEQGDQGIIVYTSDGRRLTETQRKTHTFSPDNMSWDQVVAKFRRCAEFGEYDDAERIGNIVYLIETIDQMSTINDLMNLLTPSSDFSDEIDGCTPSPGLSHSKG